MWTTSGELFVVSGHRSLSSFGSFHLSPTLQPACAAFTILPLYPRGTICTSGMRSSKRENVYFGAAIGIGHPAFVVAIATARIPWQPSSCRMQVCQMEVGVAHLYRHARRLICSAVGLFHYTFGLLRLSVLDGG